jgi:hypothetical protein
LCWLKSFSLLACGNECRIANMRERMLASREGTWIRFSPESNVGGSLGRAHVHDSLVDSPSPMPQLQRSGPSAPAIELP